MSKLRYIFFLGLIAGSFTLLLSRLFDLTGIKGAYYEALSDENRSFVRTENAPRGRILDRFGTVLVENESQFFIDTSSGGPRAHPEAVAQVGEEKALQYALSSPSALLYNPRRVYEDNGILFHVLGMIGFLDKNEATLEQSTDEKIGKSGVEKSQNGILSGVKGQTQFEMSAGGVLIRKLSQIRPYSGKDISLSIDANLSKVASDALHNRPGAVVVTDAKNGQVLVLVSTPGMNRDDYSANLHNEDKPLLNRAVLGYAPGSTFKLITAIAGLENGTIDAASKFNDKGEIKVGEQTFRNWYFRTNGKTEGEINVARALTRSTDTFFYDLANKVGPEKIQGYAKRFHLGILTGIELPEETSGLIPTPAWKERTIGSKWFTGDTFNMGIGQGYVLATPLQINMMTAAIANGGQWCAPTLLLGKGKQCEDTAVTTSTLETVLDGMVGACSHGGTGVPFFAVNDSLPAENKVACKTGTAELGVSDSNGKKKTHAWFTMVYPRENPKVAITVFLESGGSAQFLEGSSDAAPIAKTVWDAWRVKYDH